jgi:GAF domain
MTQSIATAAALDTPQPETTFIALQRLVQDTIGAKLFTVMEVDHTRGVAWRSYSNMPDAYPTKGEKPLMQNTWSDIVFGQHKTFVANSIQDIAAVFPDHELIQTLGCESCLNLPIIINGQLRGTLNCLHDAGHYTPVVVP